jgi:hypothetical protein
MRFLGKPESCALSHPLTTNQQLSSSWLTTSRFSSHFQSMFLDTNGEQVDEPRLILFLTNLEEYRPAIRPEASS